MRTFAVVKNSTENTAALSLLYSRLREEIQKKLDVDVVTSRFFSICAEDIHKEQHVRVSTSTLKRFWQYVNTTQDYAPNHYTLDVMARFAGYASWNSFCQGDERNDRSSSQQRRARIMAGLTRIEEQIATLQKDVAEMRKILEE